MDLTLRPSPKLTGLKWAPSVRKPGWALSAPPALSSYLKSPPLEGLIQYIDTIKLKLHFNKRLAIIPRKG